MSAIVLGLDVSRDRMGWGAVTLDEGKPVGCGAYDLRPVPKSDGFDELRPARIRDALREVDNAIAAEGRMSIYGPSCVYIEAPYAGGSGKVTVELALAVGSAWQAVSRRWPGVSMTFLAPKEWKALAHVTPDPPGVKGVALRWHAYRSDPCSSHVFPMFEAKPAKPYVYLRALELGFDPKGSQDAADAALIAVAGQRHNAKTWDRGMALAAEIVEAA